jgi:Ca-activated chloride channel family protein
MTGVKIEQAREAARLMLGRLGAIDSFNVIAFDDLVRGFRGGPVPASSANLVDARSFVDTIAADGSTDIDAALRAGLTGIGPETDRFDALILLSDGMATAGETRDVQIHDNALLYNQAKARLFTFSIGAEADVPLMEALARSNRGRHVALNNAQASSEIVARVDELFEDIRMPRLTDLEVSVLNVGAGSELPDPMTDLFSGGQAIVVGRYASPGPATIRIEGDDNAAPFIRQMVADAPGFADGNEFIKYVWATERVSHLLADMSRGGDVPALVAEITQLGLAYRIQTPYTSFSTEGLGGGGGDGGGGGGGGGGDSWGAGASGPAELAIAVLLVWASRRRRGQGVV